jgi:predicted dehydrogenase
MSEQRVRVALIGCGDHGRKGHLEAYQKAIREGAAAAVVAVCDRSEERARDAAAEYGVPQWFTDHQEMLAQIRPDAVSVATPPLVHLEQVKDALAAGAHVLCEKPLAMGFKEAEEMTAAAQRAGRILTMGLQNRYQPAAQYLRAVLAGDRRWLASEPGELPDLGRVYHTRVWAGHVLRLPPSRHFFDPRLAGGGVIAATAVHILDAVLWMLGNPEIRSVSATTFARTHHMRTAPDPFNTPEDAQQQFGVEDFAFGMVRFRDKGTLTIETSWLMHPTSRSTGVEFLATGGVATYGPLAVRLDDGKEARDVTPGADVVPQKREHYFLGVVRDFLRAARTGEATCVEGPQMVQVQRLMDRLYESAREGREVAF